MTQDKEVLQEILTGIKNIKNEILDLLQKQENTSKDIIEEYFQNISPKGEEPLYQQLVTKTQAQVIERPKEEMGSILGAYFGLINLIAINESISEKAKLRVLIHELAHGLLKHEGSFKSRDIKEVEAEMTTYLFLKELGKDFSFYSFPYIVKEAGEKAEEILISQWSIILEGVHLMKKEFGEL